jgi:hypothetical protein
VSDDARLSDAVREATELRLTTALRVALEQKAAFELEVLNARDHAASQAAEIGELRHRLLRFEHSFEAHQTHDANHRAHIARLESALAAAGRNGSNAEALRRELNLIKLSITWKLGRVLMFPVRALKRLLRRG